MQYQLSFESKVRRHSLTTTDLLMRSYLADGLVEFLRPRPRDSRLSPVGRREVQAHAVYKTAARGA